MSSTLPPRSAGGGARGELLARVQQHLSVIYPDLDAITWGHRLIEAIGGDSDALSVPQPFVNHWDERDAIIITYGNSVTREGEAPLQTLRRFLNDHLSDAVSGVHILPFFPYSSDDGFAVINYLQVNDALGDWEDIREIAEEFDLMADLVINHASARSGWFENFKKRIDPGLNYFVEVDPDSDVSMVVRPRPSPLLQTVQTLDGERTVWCTFGPDQVDLNFANPQVLWEFVNILGRYLDVGVRTLRMDAVAFLWKEIGTPCIHLRRTHEIIKLLRTLAEFRRPDVLVITETNVPNRDNLTYFGNANEAHAIYNFSLPPLLVHTMLSGNCRHLKTWMMSMPPAQHGTTYLNFIASHDGIGLRPAEGLLSDEELASMIDALRAYGAEVSMRAGPDGALKPYEVNISLIDAMAGTAAGQRDRWQFERFICMHLMMLGLEGIPAIYVHSFLATPNDHDLFARSGRARSINRHQWPEEELSEQLADETSLHARVLRELSRSLAIRRRQPAFHPNATQFTLHLGLELFAYFRQSTDRSQSIFCVYNVTDRPQVLSLADVNLISTDQWIDLLSGTQVTALAGEMTLAPYQGIWLSNRAFGVALPGLRA
ncbi:MAG: sugar phosphorylase [Pseudomonadota bacterium]